MSFFENTRKPVGLGGKIMVAMMNLGHSPVARWGLRFLELTPDAKVLDCGCGGGANIKRLLKKCPEGIVKGIDYSPVSVERARSLNRAAIQEGRCVVWQGSVERIIFAKDWFDAESRQTRRTDFRREAPPLSVRIWGLADRSARFWRSAGCFTLTCSSDWSS